MADSDQLERFICSFKRVFRIPFRRFLRTIRSKGHGVHSPFAFDLITNVIHAPHHFYAFSDIREIVSRKGLNPNAITRFNHLSFRLVHYLQAKNILEINPGDGINTLFLTAPSPHIRCRCVAEEGERYDAIFIQMDGSPIPAIPLLMEWSHPATFWVFHPIKKGATKQFWNEIVHDERARVTFDVKETGIVFLKPGYQKENYLV